MSSTHSSGSLVEYRFPPVSDAEVASVAAAYQEVTGRQVWPKMRGTIARLMRLFGPELVPLMRKDMAEHGVQDMLGRLLAMAEERSDATPMATPAPEASARVTRPAEPKATPSREERIAEVNDLLKGLPGPDAVPDGLLEDRRLTKGLTIKERQAAALARIASLDADAYDELVDQLAVLKADRELI